MSRGAYHRSSGGERRRRGMQPAKVCFEPARRERDDWPPEVDIDEDAFERIDESGRIGPWWLVVIVSAVGGFLGGLLERALG